MDNCGHMGSDQRKRFGKLTAYGGPTRSFFLYIIQHAQTVASSCLKQAVSPTTPITSEFAQERLLMASMRDLPDKTRTDNAICSGHVLLA